mgnify:CR=1 FL=1
MVADINLAIIIATIWVVEGNAYIIHEQMYQENTMQCPNQNTSYFMINSYFNYISNNNNISEILGPGQSNELFDWSM